MDLFIDLAQNQRIAEAQGDASSARSVADRMDIRITELERRADRTALACQALWEILRAKTHTTDSEVFAKMEEVDLRDGKADGKISGQVLRCGRCNRSINSARTMCLYCGYKNAAPTVAR